MSNPYLSLLNISWRYAKRERKKYVLVYALFLICSAGLAINPLLYGWIVNAIQHSPQEVLHSVWIYIGCYLSLQILISAVHNHTRVRERQLAFNISQNFVDELFHQLLHLPLAWHRVHHSGATINRLKKAYGSLKGFFQNGFFYFYTFAQFVFSFVAMLYFSPLFGIVALLLGFFTIWVIIRFDKPFIKSLEDTNEQEHLMSATLADSIVNIFTVITLRLEKRMKVDLRGKFEKMSSPFRRNTVINEWKWFTAGVLITVIYAVMVLGYVYGNYKPGETFYLGGLVALLGFVNQFTNAFTRIAQAYTDIVGYNTDVKTIKNIQEAYLFDHRQEGKSLLPANWRTMEIKQLNFNYTKVQQRADNVLDNNSAYRGLKLQGTLQRNTGINNIQLRFKRGQKIALIGESGSGKSTLLALLRGLFSPLPGFTLMVDKKVINDWAGISDVVTLFPQQPEIFENTISYNITMGLPFSEQEILEACEVVCLSDLISQLPQGLESNIQENGVNLSIGQKQRLALARGLLAARNSSIVLLDEPTSSIDTQTEIQIHKRLFETFSNKVVVSSLHGLHLLGLFDYGYVLHEGRVIEEGTSAELFNGDYLRSARAAVLS